ncbi:MAG TPA: response regulator transcription factor [Thermoanaerobaculia bacterium]|jgi:two-component system OmpR family response regulator
MRLLLVEDEPLLARRLVKGLREEGYGVDHAASRAEAADLAAAADFDLILLDLRLPDGPGLDLLVRWRREALATPVLILTAMDGIEDRVRGLDAGADDYLTKPFAFEELLARARSLLRRRSAPPLQVLACADLRLDRTRRQVERGGESLDLTAKEFALLEYFMLHPGAVLDRATISEHVWDFAYEARSNVIDVMVTRLRRKLEAAGAPRLIHTVKGSGYIFGPPRRGGE